MAAVEALGAIGADEAVDDLIEARDDEEGQDLDHVVFAALARIPERGLPVLRGFVEHPDARVRERALAALSTVGRDSLVPIREALVRDPSPSVRRIAIDCFGEDDETLAALALNDPNAGVRCAALNRVASLRPDIVRSGFFDPDETVRVVALEAGARQQIDVDEPDFVANVEAWLHTAGVALATASAAALPTLAGTRSASALSEAAGDSERHPEVRIAALRSLGRIGTEESVDALRRAAVDRSRQVRLAALAALAELTRSAPSDTRYRALAVLTHAVRGSLAPEPIAKASADNASPPAPVVAAEQGDVGPAVATPDGETPPTPTPTPSASDDAASTADSTEPAYPRATLEAIGGRAPVAKKSTGYWRSRRSRRRPSCAPPPSRQLPDVPPRCLSRPA